MRTKVIGAFVSATIAVTGLIGAAAPANAAAAPLSGQVVGGFTTSSTCEAGRAEWRNRGFIVGSCRYAGGTYYFIARR